jgi:hypothetical protein
VIVYRILLNFIYFCIYLLNVFCGMDLLLAAQWPGFCSDEELATSHSYKVGKNF